MNTRKKQNMGTWVGVNWAEESRTGQKRAEERIEAKNRETEQNRAKQSKTE